MDHMYYGLCYALKFTGVIPKSTREDRIQKNMALFDFVIGEEDMLRISSLDRQEHFCWNPEHIT